MTTRLDPSAREDCLLEVEAILREAAPLQERLRRVAAAIGTALGIQRVAIYGQSRAGDPAIRVREEWTAPQRAPLAALIDAVPLIAERDGGLVTSNPRGSYCPSDCAEALPECALRGACSSIVEPLRLGAARFGSLALHDRTGSSWSEQHVSFARNAGRRIALEIAAAHHGQVRVELDAQRAGIAATVLHQVGTPVTVVVGVIDQLARNGSESPELLAAASVELSKLLRLCDDLAAIAGGTEARRRGGHSHTDVAEVVARCTARARERYQGVSSLDALVEDNLPRVRCDAGDLEHIVMRLIDNAVRYAGTRAGVAIACSLHVDCVHVVVSDDGPGMTSAQASTLGKPFVRLDPGMRTYPGGNGLSLAVAQSMAHAHGGNVSIEPRTDTTGTRVTLVLPVVSTSTR